MKRIVFIITLLASAAAMPRAAAQTDSVAMAELKAQLKREIIDEIRTGEAAGKPQDGSRRTRLFTPYGFVRNYICYDTRQCITTMGEMFNIMPRDVLPNEDGSEDLNAVHEMTFVSFTTRLGVDINGPSVWKARSSAKVEGDFCGFGSNNTLFRIRQAYVRLAWPRVQVTCGQAWHPMVIQVMPSISGLASGAPFSPFNRSPQMNVSIDAGKGWNITAAALYQFPNTSVGPDGTTYDYSRWSLWPELYASVKHAGEHLTVGAGVDILSIMPRKTSTARRTVTADDGTTATKEITVRVRDRVTGISPEIFADYRNGAFNLKGKVIYGQNTAHLTMISGFGATAYDPQTGSYEYAPLRSVTSWINLTYGTRCMAGIMGGFSQNLGAGKDFISTADYWVRGAKNTDYIYRISPSLTYTVGKLALALEMDYTVVGYGDEAIDGRAKALRAVDNWRICTMIRYSF